MVHGTKVVVVVIAACAVVAAAVVAHAWCRCSGGNVLPTDCYFYNGTVFF